MDIKKIIKEELGDFDWVEDVPSGKQPEEMIHVGAVFNIEKFGKNGGKVSIKITDKDHLENQGKVIRVEFIEHEKKPEDVGEFYYLDYRELLEQGLIGNYWVYDYGRSTYSVNESFDWADDVPAGYELKRGNTYNITFCNDEPYEEERIKERLIKLFDVEIKGYKQFNWFNNNLIMRAIREEGGATLVLKIKSNGEVSGSWDYCDLKVPHHTHIEPHQFYTSIYNQEEDI